MRACVWTAVLLLGAAAGAADAKPNVLVILVDDVGWGEFGFQGCKDIPTPNIDSIAQSGVRFTQGYVSGPYCSPTRAGLLTGRYQTRFGHEFNSVANQSGLSLKETTLADRMKALGYATAAVGKWHLGQRPEYRPWRRGFDSFYGTLANTPFFHPTNFIDSRVSKEVQKIEDDSFYTTDAYGKRSVEFVEENKDRPWFLYLPFNAQHAPLQAPKKYLDRFANIEQRDRRTFAAMMSAMDDAIGRVLSKIRDVGQEERTLVFLLSDNGGPTMRTTSSNGPLRGYKGQTWEGGVRVPFAIQWKGKVPAGKVYDHPVIQLDILPTAVAAAGGSIDPNGKLDGVDLLPYLTGAAEDRPHETLYWRFGDQWAVRHGDWKLVVGRDGGQAPGLYDLAHDIAESHNLAGAHPEVARKLQALYDAWNAEQAPPTAAMEQNRAAKPKAQKKAMNRKAKKTQRAKKQPANPKD